MNSHTETSPVPIYCKSCLKRAHYFYGNECNYTKHGAAFIPDCVCKDCLIRAICRTVCLPFIKQPTVERRFLEEGYHDSTKPL